MSLSLTRRRVLELFGVGAATALIGCDGTAGSGGPDAPGLPDGSGGPDASVDAGADLCGPAAVAWAVGGTAAMTRKDCYPDPFSAAVASCPLVVCATTAGPCTATAPVREDVSEGYPGLPVRLALKIVSATTCAPVVGAVIEIWHTQVTGVYSGVTPSPGFCSGGDADAPNHSYFRGKQTTDATGRVHFDTCFPGWYPGRAIHIHFRVTVGATSYLVSQLFFDTALTTEIFANHPTYQPEGQPNVSNANDGVIGGGGSIAQYLLDTQRMSDGAMLASKVIALRSAAQPNCST
ncbi:MAG: protocatechuate 3,4-dioxygenase [Deltaproteobacteria bacterium]|nr:protocatechuate 3,4-dioxygenase [Deltaproteobacteria bacterium]